MKIYEKKPETASVVCWGDEGCEADLAAALNPDQIREEEGLTKVAYEGGWRELADGDRIIVSRNQAQLVLPQAEFDALYEEVV